MGSVWRQAGLKGNDQNRGSVLRRGKILTVGTEELMTVTKPAKRVSKLGASAQTRVNRGLVEVAPFVSRQEMREFAASRVKYRLEDLKPAKRRTG